MTSSSIVYVRPRALVMMAVMLSSIPTRLLFRQQMVCGGSVVFQPSRGSKKKWGSTARDPYDHLKKKLAVASLNKHAKVPLKSKERATRELAYPINIQSLGQLISIYVPPEKFARLPLYTIKGVIQRWNSLKESIQTLYGIGTMKQKLRKIAPLRPAEFAKWGQDQFIAANTAIQNKDKISLRRIATENASESLKKEFNGKVFKWKFINQIERPRVVTARVAPLQLDEKFLYGQLVVRLCSEQIMAVYDTTGRLIRGHPSLSKKVIDYVVFERPLTTANAQWRICAKLPPQKPLSPSISS